MLVHTIRFSFKDDVDEAGKAEVLAALRKLERTSFCVVGQDLGEEPDGFTHTFCAAWEDLGGMEHYLGQPGHRATVSLFAERAAKFASVDFSDDMDPTLSAQLKDLHQRSMEADPELAERIGSVDH